MPSFSQKNNAYSSFSETDNFDYETDDEITNTSSFLLKQSDYTLLISVKR